MDQGKLEDFIANAALLAAHLSQQCERASTELRDTASAFRGEVAERQAALAAGTRLAVRESLATEVPPALRQIEDASGQIRTLLEQLQRQQQGMEQRASFLGWKTLGAVATASIVLLTASGYFAWSNVRRAQETRVQAEVLEALRHVAITSCDGRPCVKLADGLARWAKNDEYVLVDGTAASAPSTP